jgi:hypothetical protein
MISDTAAPAFIVVSVDDIAERAYGFYVDRGYAHGFDREDWLRAEGELKDPHRVPAGASGATFKTVMKHT